MELKMFRSTIKELRTTSDLWNVFEANLEDSAIKRYAISKELQYTCTKDDYELIKYLLIEEIESRRNDKFQGFGDCLILLSYLLAIFRKPENVLIFEKAKLANFDTFCGYDARFIFSAGVKETYQFLENIELNEQNGYLFKDNQLLDSEIKDEDITNLFEKFEFEYPRDPDDETIHSRLTTAISLKDEDKYVKLYEELEKSSDAEIRQLSYFAQAIGRYDKEIYYLEKEHDNASKYFDKVSLLIKLAAAYLSWDKPVESYNVFVEVQKLLKKFDDWKRLGLGMSLVHQWFKISLALHEANNMKLGKKAYTFANKLIWVIKKPSCALLRDANQVVKKYGSQKDIEKYKAELEKEELRIIELLGK